MNLKIILKYKINKQEIFLGIKYKLKDPVEKFIFFILTVIVHFWQSKQTVGA